MLPDDFQWDTQNQWGQNWLRCGRVIVASVSTTAIPGIWIGKVNRHDELSSHPHAYFRRLNAAKRMAERWACVHAARLRQEILTGARRRPPEQAPSREQKRMQRQLRG
ncbi:hypothetical protein [uncultured Xanthomonas sp.]|uniref:hypothetical protein n=1 Tax=uncultured Xanthomonas sp. TaxID=152831 RepID=UPI0025F196D7|nr:hypothetical protein [uncultured Xanthomonas sp.]